MPHCVISIGCEADFNDYITFHSNVLGQGFPRLRRVIEHHDAVMVSAHAQFILGTNHAHRNFSSDFAFLDLERLTSHGMQGGPDGGNGNFLTFSHIARTAYDVQY